MTRLRSSLEFARDIIRRNEPPAEMTHAQRVEWGRHLLRNHDVVVLWRRDLTAFERAAVECIQKRLFGENL